MANIYVWQYNGNYWYKTNTDSKMESLEELNFFRVMKNGHKEFYWNSKDFLSHYDIQDEELFDVNGKLLS
jgi:hypothetical protein